MHVCTCATAMQCGDTGVLLNRVTTLHECIEYLYIESDNHEAMDTARRRPELCTTTSQYTVPGHGLLEAIKANFWYSRAGKKGGGFF
jgi:hypothetical protein